MSICYVGVSQNSGTSKSSILNHFNRLFTLHFGGKTTPIFGLTPPCMCIMSTSQYSHRLHPLLTSREPDFLGGDCHQIQWLPPRISGFRRFWKTSRHPRCFCWTPKKKKHTTVHKSKKIHFFCIMFATNQPIMVGRVQEKHPWKIESNYGISWKSSCWMFRGHFCWTPDLNGPSNKFPTFWGILA